MSMNDHCMNDQEWSMYVCLWRIINDNFESDHEYLIIRAVHICFRRNATGAEEAERWSGWTN